MAADNGGRAAAVAKAAVGAGRRWRLQTTAAERRWQRRRQKMAEDNGGPQPHLPSPPPSPPHCSPRHQTANTTQSVVSSNGTFLGEN